MEAHTECGLTRNLRQRLARLVAVLLVELRVEEDVVPMQQEIGFMFVDQKRTS